MYLGIIECYLCELNLCYVSITCFKNYYNIHFVGIKSGGSSYIARNKTGSRKVWTKDEEAMLNILVVVATIVN